MKQALTATLLLTLFAALAAAGNTLDIYFIDVEGGQATLIVTPAGESLLIDAGYAARGGRGGRGGPPLPPATGAAGQASAPGPGATVPPPVVTAAAPIAAPIAAPFAEPGRDPSRVLEVIHSAGLTHLDYLLVTHYHPDHVGGVPEIASKIAIGTFIDYGPPLGIDRMTAGGFRNYEPIRGKGTHLEVRPGDRLPLKGLDADVVSAGGALLSTPLSGGGEANPACTMVEDHPEDGTENFRSIGVMFRFGAFRFLDLGDLSGNTLTAIACPKNLLGPVSVYLIAHHGDYDTNVPALYAALRPRVSIMNNGVTRGGSPDAFVTLQAQRNMDLWQLHASQNQGAQNAPDEFLANVDDGVSSYSLTLRASDDGSFRIVNTRNGFSKQYSGTRPD